MGSEYRMCFYSRLRVYMAYTRCVYRVTFYDMYSENDNFYFNLDYHTVVVAYPSVLAFSDREKWDKDTPYDAIYSDNEYSDILSMLVDASGVDCSRYHASGEVELTDRSFGYTGRDWADVYIASTSHCNPRR